MRAEHVEDDGERAVGEEAHVSRLCAAERLKYEGTCLSVWAGR